MSRTFIRTTPRAALRPLGVQGRTTLSAHQQLRALIRNRLGPRHAALLAEPAFDPGRDSIDWHADAAGDAVPLDRLAPEERAATERDLAALVADIAALGAGFAGSRREEERALAPLIEQALSYPGGESLYRVGDQPVVVGWGCAPSEDGAMPERLTRLRPAGWAPARPAAPRPMPEPEPVAAGPVAVAVAPVVPPVPAWLWWLVLAALLLLVLVLLLRWLDPLPVWLGATEARERQQEAAVRLDSARDREMALRDEAARLRLALAQRRLEGCTAPRGDTGDLTIPDDSARRRDVGFMAGCWSAFTDLTDRSTGKPITARYCFAADGEGMTRIEGADGLLCEGKANAGFLADGRLEVVEPGDIACPDGSSFYRSRIVCRAGADGLADCSGRQSNGNRFAVRFRNAGPVPDAALPGAADAAGASGGDKPAADGGAPPPAAAPAGPGAPSADEAPPPRGASGRPSGEDAAWDAAQDGPAGTGPPPAADRSPGGLSQ